MKASLLLILLLLPLHAQAQELEAPARQQGYFVAAGVQSSVSRTRDSDFGTLGAAGGGQAYLRIGQMLNHYFGVGLVFDGGLSRNGDWDDAGGSFRIEGSYKPIRRVPFSVQASLGLAVRSLSRRDAMDELDDDPSGTFGAGYALGASYDWFPGRADEYSSGGISVTFSAQVQALPAGDVFRMAGLVGVGLTYWSGLPDSKLELPVDRAFAK